MSGTSTDCKQVRRFTWGAAAVLLASTLVAFPPVQSTSHAQEQLLLASDGVSTDYFGRSVAVDGDTMIVGANGDDGTGVAEGSAYVFTRSLGTWTQQAKLTASDAGAEDYFGSSVDIDGDTVVVGAVGDDDRGANAGAVYVFMRSGTTWSQQAKLTASDGASGDGFGGDVAFDGDTVVVGAPGVGSSNAGAIYVFVRSGTTWSQQARLVSNDLGAWDHFGVDVDVSGDTVVVGAHLEDTGASESGSVYTFKRSGTTWSQEAKFYADDVQSFDYFGESVSLEGDTLVVGSYREDDAGTDAGAAYVYTRSGSTWTQRTKLMPGDAPAGDYFGMDVQIQPGRIIVGAYRDDDAGTNAGAAYVYSGSGASWTLEGKLVASNGAAGDGFGYNVAIGGNTVVVGALYDDDLGTDAGSAYVFSLDAPAAPTAGQAQRVSTNDVAITWDASTEPDAMYRLYRHIPSVTDILLTETTDTTYLHTLTECTQQPLYRLTVVVAGTESTPSPTFGPTPGTDLYLLCHLNTYNDFYWGPTANDDSDGAPDTQLLTIAALQDHVAMTGEVPTWYEVPPAHVACCFRVLADGNTLRETGEEIDFEIGPALDDLVPDQYNGWNDLSTAVGTFFSLGGVEIDSSGFKHYNVPSTDPAILSGQPFVDSHGGFSLSVDAVALGGEAEPSINGRLFVDGDGNIQLDGVDASFLQADVGLKGKHWAVQGHHHTEFDAPFGIKIPVDTAHSMDVNFGISVTGMMGQSNNPITQDAETSAFGVGLRASGGGTVTRQADFRLGSVSVEGSIQANGEAMDELFTPVPFLLLSEGAAHGPIVSPYTGITYEDIRTPVVVVKIGPFSASAPDVEASFRVGSWTHDGTLRGFDLHWGGAAGTFGKARVTSPTLQMDRFAGATGFRAMAAATPAYTNDLSMEPEDRVLVFEVNATAGATGNISIERPMLHTLPNGTFGVRTWSLTLPSVAVGSDGKAVLAVDVGAMEQEVLSRTAAGESFETATTYVNGQVDSNGDGTPDLTAGGVPVDARSPVRVAIESEGSTLGVGEAVTMTARVEALDGSSVPAGTVVEFTLAGTSWNVTTDALGVASTTVDVPVVAPGDYALAVDVHGDATVRHARAARVVNLVDTVPVPSIVSPPPLSVFTPTASTASLNLDTPLDATLVRVRLDGGAWMTATATATGHTADVTLSGDGVHQVEVEVTDAAGFVGTTATLLAFDSGAPDVTFDLDEQAFSAGDALHVSWSASEDVGGMARLTDVLSNTTTERHSDAWGPGGGVVFEDLAQGLYKLEAVVVDAAGNEVSSMDTTPRLVLVL